MLKKIINPTILTLFLLISIKLTIKLKYFILASNINYKTLICLNYLCSFAVWTVFTFAVLSTFLTYIETLTVFFYASCFPAIASFHIRSFMTEVYWWAHYHLVDCLGSDFTEFLSVVAWLAITALTERACDYNEKNLPCAKH